jgi:hypothetical protein
MSSSNEQGYGWPESLFAAGILLNNENNMKREIADMRESLILIGVIIMLVGLGGAILIYHSAENDSDSVLGYEIIDGSAYPIRPEDSRMYRRDLELYGGKAAMVVDDFSRWFVGLWHGKSLAFTVAGISIFISFIFFFAATRLPSRLQSNIHSKNNRE